MFMLEISEVSLLKYIRSQIKSSVTDRIPMDSLKSSVTNQIFAGQPAVIPSLTSQISSP